MPGADADETDRVKSNAVTTQNATDLTYQRRRAGFSGDKLLMFQLTMT